MHQHWSEWADVCARPTDLKIKPIHPWTIAYYPIKFCANPVITFQPLLLTDRQTNRQTDRSKNITFFIGGINYIRLTNPID